MRFVHSLEGLRKQAFFSYTDNHHSLWKSFGGDCTRKFGLIFATIQSDFARAARVVVLTIISRFESVPMSRTARRSEAAATPNKTAPCIFGFAARNAFQKKKEWAVWFGVLPLGRGGANTKYKWSLAMHLFFRNGETQNIYAWPAPPIRAQLSAARKKCGGRLPAIQSDCAHAHQRQPF